MHAGHTSHKAPDQPSPQKKQQRHNSLMLSSKLGHSLKETGGFSLPFISDGHRHFGERVR